MSTTIQVKVIVKVIVNMAAPSAKWDHASVGLPGVLHTNVGNSNVRCVI